MDKLIDDMMKDFKKVARIKDETLFKRLLRKLICLAKLKDEDEEHIKEH